MGGGEQDRPGERRVSGHDGRFANRRLPDENDRLACHSRHRFRVLHLVPVRAPHVDQQGHGEGVQETVRGPRFDQVAPDRGFHLLELQPPGAAGAEQHVRQTVPLGRRGDGKYGRRSEGARGAGDEIGRRRHSGQGPAQQGELPHARAGTVPRDVHQVHGELVIDRARGLAV